MQIEIPDLIEFNSGGNNPSDWDYPGQGQSARSEKPGRGGTILVVDDTLAWLRLARELLTKGGYQVHTCDHPHDALALFEQNHEQIDLVITDLNMPCLDGIELAAKLREIKATLPVLLTSAAAIEICSKKLQSLGIRDFLTKPWQRERLFSVLKEAFDDTRQRG